MTNAEIMQHIGRKLAQRRRELGLSLAGLAGRCDVSLQQLHKYEKAQSTVSAPMLYQLALCLEAPVSAFFPDGERAPEPPAR